MITVIEIELLAGILSRAGVTQIEAIFVNSLLDRLRAEAAAAELSAQIEQPTEEERDG